MKKIVGLVAALTLAATIAACGTDAGETAAAGPADGVGEAVSVHGNWKIDVVDPDGSVAESIAFHNEFVGQEFLTDLLLGDVTVGGWAIAIAGDPALCPSADLFCSEGAEFEAGDDGESIVVTAEIRPTNGGDIDQVEGRILDGSGASSAFSRKLMATGDGGPGVVPVEAGQVVQVEVTYTFG